MLLLYYWRASTFQTTLGIPPDLRNRSPTKQFYSAIKFSHYVHKKNKTNNVWPFFVAYCFLPNNFFHVFIQTSPIDKLYYLYVRLFFSCVAPPFLNFVLYDNFRRSSKMCKLTWITGGSPLFFPFRLHHHAISIFIRYWRRRALVTTALWRHLLYAIVNSGNRRVK